jgi:hypothetical protein
MKIIFGISVLLIITTSLTSCYYDKETLLYGTNNGPCTDTATTVSYAQKIVPILQQNCYGCHTGNFPSGNILLGNYQADKLIAQNGKMYGSISHAPGYAAMPQGQPKLGACQINAIKKWIDLGTLNN